MNNDVVAVLESGREVDAILEALMPALGKALNCHRCALFLREPKSTRSSMTHSWQASEEHALDRDRGWRPEPASLPADDPMFAEALRNPIALFIEDVANADPAEVNVEYELEHFRHSALIHAPLYHDGAMYGILEPCVFGAPRIWSEADRELTAYVQETVGPLVADHVHRHCR
jgi:GAF domain-containing protein